MARCKKESMEFGTIEKMIVKSEIRRVKMKGKTPKKKPVRNTRPEKFGGVAYC